MVTAGLGYGAAEAMAESRSSQQAWAEAAFSDLLGRPLGGPGLDRWLDRLAAGMPEEALTTELVGSHEFHARLVSFLYDHYLGRAPDPEGSAAWVAQLDAGLPVVVAEAAIVSSSEYAGTDARFVDRLYADVLGRPPDRAGHRHWVRELAGGTPRVQVAEVVLRSREAAVHRTRAALRAFVGEGELPDEPQVAQLAASLRTHADWPRQWARIAGSDVYLDAVEAGPEGPARAGVRALWGADEPADGGE